MHSILGVLLLLSGALILLKQHGGGERFPFKQVVERVTFGKKKNKSQPPRFNRTIGDVQSS